MRRLSPLQADDVQVEDSSGHAVPVTGLDYDAAHELVNIRLKVELAAGANYSLTVNYRGLLRTDFTGLYRASLGTGDSAV